jgi:transposase
VHKGQLPAGVGNKGFGVRAQGMLGLLTSKYRLSKRLVQSWFKDVYQLPVSVGSVSNIERTVSQSLEVIHQEVLGAMRTEKLVHVDETGHKECNKSGWAWIMSSLRYTYFHLNPSRGKKVAKELIGNHQGRMIITDRYGSYNFLPQENHQICWAHLKRDFQKIAERGGASGRIGKRLLRTYSQIFHFWKTDYQEGSMRTSKQRKRLRYLKNKLLKWLARGAACEHKRTARTCENILDYQGSLWHFFESRDIPPTNNDAERSLRPLVISKQLTFGTQSNRGSRYIERIFTVTASCKQQGRDVSAFIVEAIQKYFLGEKAPSLIFNPVTP